MWLLLVSCSTPEPTSAPVPPPVERRLVVPGVVATRDLPAGHVIVADDLASGSVPDFTPDPVVDPTPWLGTTVREPILGGEPFRGERTAPGRGWPALIETGTAAALSVPLAAAVGLGPGCRVEVVHADDPGRRPRLVFPEPVRVLGLEAGADGRATVWVEAPAEPPAGAVTVVATSTASSADNPSVPEWDPPVRPGLPLAVARHPLLPGRFVRSTDLAEVGGVGLAGPSLALVWARTPHQRIFPGELVRPERLAVGGVGLCVTIPDGLRAAGLLAAPGTVAPDLAEHRVTIRTGAHVLQGLYVLAVDAPSGVVTVAANPDVARAIAVVGAAGAVFDVTDDD